MRTLIILLRRLFSFKKFNPQKGDICYGIHSKDGGLYFEYHPDCNKGDLLCGSCVDKKFKIVGVSYFNSWRCRYATKLEKQRYFERKRHLADFTKYLTPLND